MLNAQQELTQHSCVRMKQRGVDQQMLDLLLDFGSIVPAGGANYICFDNCSWEQVNRQVDLNKINRSKLRKLYAVEIGGRIVTVAHRLKRIRKNFNNKRRL